MLRATIVVMMIALSTTLLPSRQAAAFTLRVGPVTHTAPIVPGSENSNIPTPQLFQVAVDTKGATLGTIAPTEGYGAPQPALRLRKRTVTPRSETPVATSQVSQQVDNPATAHRLSGAELLLLRKTSVVAERR